jgi:hypothetical protein
MPPNVPVHQALQVIWNLMSYCQPALARRKERRDRSAQG